MKRRVAVGLRYGWILAILCAVPSVLWSAEQVEVEWRFDKQGESRGWAAGGHLRDFRISGGALLGETSDWDPILLGPTFEIAAKPTQCVEIKMRTPARWLGSAVLDGNARGQVWRVQSAEKLCIRH